MKPQRVLKKLGSLIFFVWLLCDWAGVARAALVSRFDVITFRPAVDNTEYFHSYSSQNLKSMQGHLGIMFDYANRPLQFIATGAAVGRQSVIDHMMVADAYGSLGFTDWFEIGLNIPIVLYNWFFTDNAAAQEDHGSSLGDLMFMMKFRAVNSDNSPVGLAFMPFITAPSGDPIRYTGNGALTGGMKIITDFMFHERFTMALNLGATMRDDVQRHGVRIDDQFDYSLAMKVLFTEGFSGIVEAFGRTTMRDFFQETGSTPFEVGGGIKYRFPNSGFAVNVGGTAGIIDGVGAPRFRGFAGLNWTSPASQECPECPPPAPPPDPRIRGDRIVIWGKIFFDTAKDTIKPISYPVLDDVVDVMQKNPFLSLVEVQGHTDIRGGYNYNMDLSNRRAYSAMNYLVSKGVDSSRLTSKGFGYTVPIADNKTKEGMSQNRRVEFHILRRSDGV